MRFNPQPKTFTPPKEKSFLKKERTDDVGKLRKKLDLLFGKHIKKMSVKCFTCNKRAIECGHFMKRGNDATRWDEDNCRPQCWECNYPLEGNPDVFRKNLIAEIGEYRVAEVERKAKLDEKFLACDLQELINKFSA